MGDKTCHRACSLFKSYSRFYCKSARHIHSLLPFVIISVPSLTVSSTGPAATAQSSRMGVYHLTDQTFNNFPVYEKSGGGQFIYVDNGGYWSIMRYVYCTKMIFSTLFCFSELHATIRGIHHPENNPTPSLPPVTGWIYWDDGWKDDEQLTVTQTGKTQNKPMKHQFGPFGQDCKTFEIASLQEC